MTLYDRVVTALEEAGFKTSKEETKRLREEAQDAGWPREEAQSIEVHHSYGELSASFSDSAGDYEFGTEDRPPMAVTRAWQNHLDDHAARTLEYHLRNSLMSQGVL